MDAVGHTWVCDFCQDEYYYLHDLKSHKEEEGHHGTKYECESCNVYYNNYPQLKRHMHQEDHWRTHWCASCQKGFESESNLRAVR
jgi:hypothetical protein